MRDFYWFKRGGFTLAVDAMSRQDAFKYVELHNGEMEYLGAWPPPSTNQYSTATCGITERRQAYINTAYLRYLEGSYYDPNQYY